MGPINYNVPQIDIAGSLGSGFQVGAGIRNELQRRQDEQVARQQAEQQRIAEMQRAAAYERDLYDTFNDPTPQRIAKLQISYPERIKQFQDGFATLEKAAVADEQAFVGKVYSAIRSNPEVADKLLTDRIAALTNAGEDATEEQRALDLLKRDPKAALGYAASLAAFTLPKDQIDALAKLDEGARASELQPDLVTKGKAEADKAKAEAAATPEQLAANLKKTRQETAKLFAETSKVSAEAKAAVRALEDIKQGKLPPEKAFEQEEKLRKEYTTRSAKYQDAKAQNSVILASAADKSGAGDIALVTAFNKLLDPGSVVRETEFAKSQDTSGLLTRLSNAAQKLENGSFLDPKQRADFVRLASTYYAAAQKKEAEDRKAIGTVVKNYNLNEQNVFGPSEAPSAPSGGLGPITEPPASPRGPIQVDY